jgi:hypothetical protein
MQGLKRAGLAAAVASLALAAAARAGTPQIVDGGFEDTKSARNAITSVAGQSVSAWHGNQIGGVQQYLVNGQVQIASGQWEGQTPFGLQYLALDQIEHRSFRSIESQTVTGFDVGATYAISLYFAVLNNAGGTDFGALLPPTLSVAVTDGADGSGTELAYQTFTTDSQGPYGRGFIPFTEVTVEFKAASDAVTFSLGNQSYHSALGIDNVSLAEISPAPEPASWALLTVGVGLAGAALRRRRGAVAA